MIIILLLCPAVQAQHPLLNNTYSEYRANSSLAITVGPEGYTLIGSGWAQQYGGYVSTKLLRVDEYGFPVWTKVYGQEYFVNNCGSAASSFRLRDGSGIINVGTICDTQNRCQATIRKFALDGTRIWEKAYTSGYRSVFQYAIELANSDFLATGFTMSSMNGMGQALLVRLDSLGNMKWQKSFGGSDIEEFRWAVETNDGGFLLSGITASFGAGSWDVWLVKTDSVGNLQWQKTYGSAWTDYYAGVTLASDGGYYLWWEAEDNQLGPGLHPTYEKKTYLLKTNDSGDTVWEKVLNQDYFNWAYIEQLKEVDGGKEFIFTGSKKSPNSAYDSGWIVKMDSSGNKIWERFYTNNNNPGASNFLYDFKILDNGGLACTGMGHTPDTIFVSKADFWLLVLDSMGCLVPGCDTITGIGEVKQDIPIPVSVYPNPASNNITVSIAIGPESDEYEFNLINLLGQQVHSSQITNPKTTIDLDLPSGLYLYQVAHNGQIVAGKLLIE